MLAAALLVMGLAVACTERRPLAPLRTAEAVRRIEVTPPAPIAPEPLSTPAPTPTPEPPTSTLAVAAALLAPAPVATASAPVAAAPAPKAAFPPPPPRSVPPPPNSSGIARIVSARLGLDHYIEIVPVVNNEMQTPVDGSYAVGWYPDYSRPGAGGNTMFSAHETWNHLQGPFYSLYLAQVGDDVFVEMTNGQRYRYRVFSKTRYDVDTIPMAEIIWPGNRPPNEEWITLLTCGGRLVYDGNTGFGEYLDRDVVVAKRVE